jgi:TonB family protein
MNFLIDNTVNVSLVVAAGLAGRVLLRRQSAAARHWVLAIAIVCAAATPLLGLVVPSWHVGYRTFSAPGTESSDASVSTSSTFSVLTPDGSQRPDGGGRSRPSGWNFPSPRVLAGWLWLGGAAASLLILLAGLLRLTWLASRAREVDGGPWAAAASEIAAACGVHRPIAILQSEHPALLVTWGLFRPKVILPAAAQGWSDDRVRVVLRHELAHIRRGDWAVFMVAELLRAVYWFNPLVWIACRRVREDSETACDDAVLEAGVAGSDYATHLLDLARTLRAHPRRSMPRVPAPAMARPSSLQGRITAMLNASLNRRSPSSFIRVATAVALLCVTVLVAGLGGQRFFTFSGGMVDATSRILPDTKLVLTNTVSRAKYEVRSDRTGRFEFVGLPPGEYALEVTLPGFRVFKDTITVAANVDRTIELRVGSLEETVTVTSSLSDTPNTDPTPDQLEDRQELRRRAVERQRAALERCGGGPQGPMGGQILVPMKLASARPLYPQSLREAGIGGVVTLDAVIGTDGNIQDVRAVSSPHPDLEAAAIEAVRQWQFTPTLLNCVPIEVEMKVTTNFNSQP